MDSTEELQTLVEAIPKTIKERILEAKANIRTTTEWREVKRFAGTNGFPINDEWVELNFSDLEAAYNSAQQCASCNGRESCRQSGYQAIPEVYIENIRLTYRQCEKDHAAKRAFKIQRLLESSRMPKLFRSKTFDNFEITEQNKEALRKAIECASVGESGLVLAGPSGVGKTHLAAAIMNRRIRNDEESIFCTVPELLADIRRAMNSNQETTELLEIVKDAEMLILDDLGAERVTEWVAEQLFVILNARVMREKLTVITTNYEKPSDLIEKLGGDIMGKRIVSRIFELCDWVSVSGEDYRLKRRG